MGFNKKIENSELLFKLGETNLLLNDIVSHDNILTKSAEIFLEQNRFIKFKCVPFELDMRQ